MNPLKPLEVPLQGTSLIEASAGTGKTYTITTLFLRMLLEQQVSVDKILVVTFTIAATEELRIKITDRVLQALEWLNNCTDDQRSQPKADPILVELLENQDRQTALKLLEDAAARLDEASVYTIDAFCMRVLQDHAFESGLPYRIDFVADDLEIKKRATQDFWRHAVGTKDPIFIATLVKLYKDPAQLQAAINKVYSFPEAVYLPQIDADELSSIGREVAELYGNLQSVWSHSGAEISDLLVNCDALKKNIYRPASVAVAIASIEKMLQGPVPTEPLPRSFDLLTASKIHASLKKNATAPEHEFFNCCEHFGVLHKKWTQLLSVLVRSESLSYIRQAAKKYKENRSILHFEDLRSRLFNAVSSASGPALMAHIRGKWPYALIDEFQDTDPQQYHIFNSAYADQPDTGLFLIGDPKQAIYSFRGADIYAYINAKRDTDADRQFTLDTNWRSSRNYVAAVNAVFSGAEAPFVYSDEIPFIPVSASGVTDKKPLLVDGEEVVPFQFWLLKPAEGDSKSETINSADAQKQAIAACAADIRQLLEQADSGTATLGSNRVAASDIAVLVRTNMQADAMQLALREQGVRSVRLASSGVFQSAQAGQLLLLLKAVSDPSRAGLMRAALATELLGFSAFEIDQLNRVESSWDKLVGDMLRYNEILRSKGVMAALQEIFVELNLPQKLLVQAGGEQKLTNILQLGEILQIKSRDFNSVVELLHWMTSRINVQTIDEELMLRLESDEDLVKIVTIHKSKGLEYPIVYLPVPWDSPRKSSDAAIFHDTESLKITVDLGSDEFSSNSKLEQKERFAEDLRIAYVALTRAKNLCVLCWGPIKNVEKASLSYLLHPQVNNSVRSQQKAELQAHEIISDLDLLIGRAPGCISRKDLPESGGSQQRYQPQLAAAKLQPLAFTGTIRSNWKISSYTGLLRDDHSERPDHDSVESPDSAQLPVDDELTGSTDATGIEIIDDKQFDSIYAIPAGSRTGEFLHDLLENLDFTSVDDASLADTVRASLDRYGNLGCHEPARLGELVTACALLVNNTLETSLAVVDGAAADLQTQPTQSLCLKDIGNRDRLNELEFYYSVTGAGPDDINRLLSAEQAYKNTAIGLSFKALTGLMHGYIDLVIRQDNKYYIVDYKSNLLGNKLEAYQGESLRAAVQSHRYDLQYLIYTVALHRYLRNTVPDYSYSEHFGGVYYLFLRGLRVGQQTGIWFDKPSAAVIDALDNCFSSTPYSSELPVSDSNSPDAADSRERT